MTLLLAFLIGFLAGLRSLTPPAAVAWAAHLGWLKLHGIFALIGSWPVVAILTLLAIGELAADKLPRIPNRTAILPLLARIVTGKLSGMCIAIAAGHSLWIGAAAGVSGALVGCFAGYYARTQLAKVLRRDWPAALLEDLTCIGGCLWIVSRF